MSVKICPRCGKEYDEELYTSCPFCKEDDECQSQPECVLEEETLNEAASEEAAGDFDAVASQDGEYDAPDNVDGEDEEGGAESPKTKLILNIIIAVLAVLVALALGRLIYINLPYNAPDTIDVDSFTASELDGTYTDALSGQYFTFEAKSTDVEVAPQPDPLALSDALASSDAQALSDGLATETKTFDGTFESGYIKENIKNTAYKIFLMNSTYGNEYIAYKISRNLKTDAYEDFIKAYGYEKEFEEFETNQNMTAQLEADKMTGYWDISDGMLNLYDGEGNLITSCEITKNGIAVSKLRFEGKIKKAMLSENILSYTSPDGTVRQTISTYKDGNFVLTTEREGQPAQKEAGMYCISGGSMTISLGGSVDSFNLTDFGMTQQLFNKE